MEIIIPDCEIIGNPKMFGELDTGIQKYVPHRTFESTASTNNNHLGAQNAMHVNNSTHNNMSSFNSSNVQSFRPVVHPPYQPPPNYKSHGAIMKNEAPARIIPIAALNPCQGRWAIKARVTAKGSLRRYNNAKGDGKVFSFDLLDSDRGEIRATCFNAVVDRFYHTIEIGKVYIISKGSLKRAQKNFNHLKNEWEIFLETSSTIDLCSDEDAIPPQQFSFRPISDIENAENNLILDVIGVVITVNPSVPILRKNGIETQRRILNLKDQSGRSVELTLWGDFCNREGQKLQALVESGHFPVLAVKAGKVNDFTGKSIGTISSTQIFIDPDFPEAQDLRDWFDREGKDIASQSISREIMPGGFKNEVRKFVSQIKDEGLGRSDKPDWITVKATISFIKTDTFYYTACPLMIGDRQCNKKVTRSVGNSRWQCDRCNQEFEECDYRYRLQTQIQDHTGLTWVTAFQEAGEEILGCSAKELYLLKHEEQDELRFTEIIKNCLLTQYLFKLKIKEEMYGDEQRVISTVVKAEKVLSKFQVISSEGGLDSETFRIISTADELAQRLQSFDLSSKEAGGVCLNESAVLSGQEACTNSLIGKVYGGKIANFHGVRNMVTRIWGYPKHLKMMEIGTNFFQFFFSNDADKRKVLNGGPWMFENQLLIIRQWKEGIEQNDLEFNSSPMWIQIWNLPLHWITKETGITIGKLFLSALKVIVPEVGSKEGRHIKVLVEVDLQQPLMRGTYVRYNGELRWVDFKYEKCPDFCYTCGIIGHGEKSCTKINGYPNKESQYGPWLKAASGKMTNITKGEETITTQNTVQNPEGISAGMNQEQSADMEIQSTTMAVHNSELHLQQSKRVAGRMMLERDNLAREEDSNSVQTDIEKKQDGMAEQLMMSGQLPNRLTMRTRVSNILEAKVVEHLETVSSIEDSFPKAQSQNLAHIVPYSLPNTFHNQRLPSPNSLPSQESNLAQKPISNSIQVHLDQKPLSPKQNLTLPLEDPQPTHSLPVNNSSSTQKNIEHSAPLHLSLISPVQSTLTIPQNQQSLVRAVTEITITPTKNAPKKFKKNKNQHRGSTDSGSKPGINPGRIGKRSFSLTDQDEIPDEMVLASVKKLKGNEHLVNLNDMRWPALNGPKFPNESYGVELSRCGDNSPVEGGN